MFLSVSNIFLVFYLLYLELIELSFHLSRYNSDDGESCNMIYQENKYAKR